MKNIFTLVRIDFDNLENRNAEMETEVATFIDSAKETAYTKCEKFLAKMKPEAPYLGWDYEIYPKMKLKRRFADDE